jgi:hypothetical protein
MGTLILLLVGYGLAGLVAGVAAAVTIVALVAFLAWRFINRKLGA